MSITLITSLLIEDEGSKFGASLDTDGGYIVVGSPEYSSNTFTKNGIVFLYKQDNNGEIQYIEQLLPNILIDNLNFGSSVAMSGNFIVIGATGGPAGGKIFLFEYDSIHGSWVEVDEYSLEDGYFNDNFGYSVDIVGYNVIASSNTWNLNKGKTVILQIQPSYLQALTEGDFRDGIANGQLLFDGDWGSSPFYAHVLQEVSTISNPMGTATNFGSSVTMSRNYVAISSPLEDNGVVYIYSKDEDTEIFTQIQKVFASDGELLDLFGSSISMTDSFLAIGSKNKTSENGDLLTGQVYLFGNNGGRWFEQKKLSPSSGHTLESSNFGSSVSISEDYLTVGAPGSLTGEGNSEIFSKNTNWNYISEINGSIPSTGTTFIVSGSPLSNNCYIYKDIISKINIAQEFEVNQQFLPSKASVYLKRCGENYNNYFILDKNTPTIIDTTNFSKLTQNTNTAIIDDRLSGYSGGGYMAAYPYEILPVLTPNSDLFSIIEYPIKSTYEGLFYITIRGSSLISNIFDIDILLDNKKVANINTTNIILNEWEWSHNTYMYVSVLIPDKKQHILGIKIKEHGNIIDKIIIAAEKTYPIGEGPNFLNNTYITTHLRLFNQTGDVPNEFTYIYDYKTTIDEIIKDDWYNFNLKVLDSRFGYTQASDFTDNYYIIISTSGTNSRNYILWDIEDTGDYINTTSSAIKI